MRGRRGALVVAGVMAGVLALGGEGSAQRGGAASRPEAYADAALVVVLNVRNDEGVCKRRRLVRYRFEKERAPRAEVMMEREQRFFGHFARHRLMANRFLVTKFGSVIDLTSGDVIHDESLGEVLGIEGDEVVFHVENVHRGSGVFAFDVPSRRLRKLESPGTWALSGVRSPDGRHTAESTPDGELWLHSVGREPRRLAAGLGVSFSVIASVAGVGPPVFWLDEKTLLTQIDNGRLVTVGLHGVVTPLVEIADVPAPVTRPRFERDGAGTTSATTTGRRSR